MKLARFGDDRLGVVVDETAVVDVTDCLPTPRAVLADSLWQEFCGGFDSLRPQLEAAASRGPRIALADCVLRSPVVNASKIVAAAANYGDHVEEMRDRVDAAWLLDFDVFLKAPSSITGPGAVVSLPQVDGSVEFEAELALVMQHGGARIAAADALDHVLGYTILVDVTVRGKGDRSRRKSYDGFSPIGPWIVTRDEIGNPSDLRIRLWNNGELKQDVLAGAMLRSPAEVIAYASQVMTLLPGDVIATGAPPGVGAVEPGDTVRLDISRIGSFEITFDAVR